jgi:hypothetical protein
MGARGWCVFAQQVLHGARLRLVAREGQVEPRQLAGINPAFEFFAQQEVGSGMRGERVAQFHGKP